MDTLDHLIEEVGSCGLFQIILSVAVIAACICSVWGMLLMAFGSYSPGWICLDDIMNQTHDLANMTSYGTSSLSISRNRSELERVHHTSNNIDRCDLYKACRNVSFLPGSSTIVTEWSLVCDLEWVPSIIFTIQMVGVMLGAYIAGFAGDSLGRRITMYGMLAFHAITNLVAVFSPTWQVFAGIRFFIGLSVGGILASMSVFPAEFLGQYWRGVYAAFPRWNVGSASFALGVWILRDWRQLHLVAFALSVVLFLPVLWVPESLRWLTTKGRSAKATEVARKIARVNGRPQPTGELLDQLTSIEKRFATDDNLKKRYTYVDLFRYKSLRKTTICMGLIWVSIACVYYGLSFGIQALSGDFYINFLIFAVAEIPGNFFVIPALSYLGRRWGATMFFLVISLCCIAVLPVTLFLADEEDEALRGKIVMALALTAKFAVSGCWALLTVFSGELYPTVVRGLGYGYLNTVARIGGMIGPLLFPKDPALLHVVLTGISILMLACAALSLALPETKGVALLETVRSNKTLLVEANGNIQEIFEEGENKVDAVGE